MIFCIARKKRIANGLPFAIDHSRTSQRATEPDVDHMASIPEERMLGWLSGRRIDDGVHIGKTDHLPAIVDIEAETDGPAKCAEIMHLSRCPEKCMRLRAIRGLGPSCYLLVVADGKSIARKTIERSQADDAAILPNCGFRHGVARDRIGGSVS